MIQIDEPLAAIRTGFFQECEELLEQLVNALTDSGFAASAPDPINAAFRAVHSLKGGAASFGLDQLSTFAHQFENTLDDLRAGRRRVDLTLMSGLQEAADHLCRLVEAARENCACGDGGDLLPAPAQPVNTAPDDWLISFCPATAFYVTGNEPLHILNALLELQDARIELSTESLPALADIIPEEGYLKWQIRVSGTLSEQVLREYFEFVEDVCNLTIARVTNPGLSQVATTLPSQHVSLAERNSPTIRVDIARIDRLMNLVGELHINQSTLEQTLGLVERHSPLRSAFDLFTSLITDMQEAVVAIRAQPVKPLFQRMSRILREAAHTAGKDAELLVQGELIEIDRSIIDGLIEPLTHMVRNAVDHGLESPLDRHAAGKPACGRVTLSAAHRAGRVYIELADDGAGIDRVRVHEIALARGLIRADQHLSESQIDELLFHPGLSTAATVSALSGRGVGLDVVRAALVRLGGRVAIQSQAGQGTRFSLSLPLTLTVTDCMTLRSGGQILLLPLAVVRETVRLHGADIRRLADGAELIQIRGQLFTLCDVTKVLGLKKKVCNPERAVAVIINDDENDRQAAMIFDEVVDQRQVVIKGLRANCGTVAGIAAATILGDGRVALILDPGDLIRRADASAMLACDQERCVG